MTDYYGVALTGFATGLGVIFAQKFVAWLEHHPLLRRVTRKIGDVVNFDIERESGQRKNRR